MRTADDRPLPIFSFGSLSLNDDPSSEQELEHQGEGPVTATAGSPSSLSGMSPDTNITLFGREYTKDFKPVLLPSASKSPSETITLFGKQYNKDFSPLTPGRATGSAGGPNIAISGGNTSSAQGSMSLSASPFIFRGLHNATPLPSPLPSREPSPQPSTSIERSHLTSASIPPKTLSGPSSIYTSAALLHPSSPLSPTPTPRARALSTVSSQVSTPEKAIQSPSATSTDAPLGEQPLASVTPYDAKEELAPAHALFTTAFQDALKNGSSIANDTVIAIEKLAAGGWAGSTADVKKYLTDAKSFTAFRSTDTRTIAVLGDSGEGKSSLINSLLHIPGVAQTGDIGSACTSVVTEYRQKKPEHVAAITIEAEYLSKSEIQELVRELLWSYRQLFLPIVESSNTSEQDYVRYTRESEHAWSALEAAFKHKRQFTQTYARDMSEGALEKITEQLLQWVDEIEWPQGARNGLWTSNAETAEQCVDQTRFFSQDRFWPFTKIIRVYLSSQILKTGLVLADLPGLHDTNLARVRATQDYLIKCDNIIIVAKISRAITDQSLKSSLFHVFSQHVPAEWEQSGAQNFKVAVVCTRSEDINPRTARPEFCGPNKRIPEELMVQLDKEIADAKATGDNKRKKMAKKQQELLLVQARNGHVRENLQSLFASEMHGRRLDVFCVSNKWYEKYCPKGNIEFVHASGIPELRRFCHTISADAQFKEAKNFLKARMSACLNSLDIWASSLLNAQQKPTLNASIVTKLDNIRNQIPGLIQTFRSGFTQSFQDQIMKAFRHRDMKWQEAATQQGQEWKTWHWTQYNAWCKNNGIHSTLKRGSRNWNTEIIWKMRIELDGLWELVEDDVGDSFSALLEGLLRLLEELKVSLHESGTSQSITSLGNGLDSYIQNIEYTIRRQQGEFLTAVKTIKRYTMEANHNSYIMKEMVPFYRSASNELGSGMGARQQSIIQGHIESETVFPQLSIAVFTSMEASINSIADALHTFLRSVLASIRADFDNVLHSQGGVMGIMTKENERQLEDFAKKVKDLNRQHGLVLWNIKSL
ncbi:hypothetical protein B0I35DRAFT_434291 [Stachybotrys elegans]|uniref:G domain-containing protein n=1 Tax=Stachybotrys elegans TaxID=80388 RepID=A0A8K0WR96_9HYPO|nr:hypothetical protein B0I35DRAFT_434291 [Stachybotrys elegans]